MSKFNVRRSLIFVFISLAYVTTQFHRFAPAVLMYRFSDKWSVSIEKLSVFTSAFFWIYSLPQPINGILADTVGPRLLLSVGGLLGSIGVFMTAFAPNFGMGVAGRAITGLGTSVIYVPSTRLLTVWFQSAQFPVASGVFYGLGTLGSVLATQPVDWLADQIGLSGALAVAASVGTLAAVGAFFVVANDPLDVFTPDEASTYLKLSPEQLSTAYEAALQLRVGHRAQPNAVVEEQDPETGSSEHSTHDSSPNISSTKPEQEPAPASPLRLVGRDLLIASREPLFYLYTLFLISQLAPFMTLASYLGMPLFYSYGMADSASTIFLTGSLVVAVAAPLTALISNFMGKNMALMTFSLPALATYIFFATVTEPSKESLAPLYYVAWSAIALSAAQPSVAFAGIKGALPDRIAGAAIGMSNCVPFVVAAIFQSICGAIVKAPGTEPCPANAPDDAECFTFEGWRNTLIFLTIVVSLGPLSAIAAHFVRKHKNAAKSSESANEDAPVNIVEL